MEAFLKKYFKYVLVVLFVFLLFFVQCSRNNALSENKRLKSNIEALNDKVSYQENKIGGITASKKALEVTEKELRKQIFVKDERIAKLTKDFKELKSVVNIEQEIKLVEVPIYYKDTIPFVFERKFNLREKWYSIDGLSNQKGVFIDKIEFPNEQFVIVGKKSEGLFKPNYLTVDVVNTNPNFKTINITTQVIQVETPFYNKGWFRASEIVGAFVLGAYIAK